MLSWHGNHFGIMDPCWHYRDAVMNTMASQTTGVSVHSSVHAYIVDQRKHQCSASCGCVCVWGGGGGGDSPVTGEFPAQRASKEDNVYIWWRHDGMNPLVIDVFSSHRTNNTELWWLVLFSATRWWMNCRVAGDMRRHDALVASL